MQADERGWLWSTQLQLFLGIENRQLRYFTPEGKLVSTPTEAAQAAETLLERYRERFGDLPD
jgi:hypothetical protein